MSTNLSTNTPTVRKGPFRAFASPDFTLFWLGSLLSMTSFFLLIIARGWLVLEMTNSPFMVTAVAGAAQLPSLVLSIPGGIIADRFDRRLICLIGESVNCFAMLALAILVATQNVEIWHIFATGIINGTSFALTFPARAAIVPNLVPRDDIANGVALASTMFSGAQFIGPALAGILLASFALSTAFFAPAGASAVAVMIFLFVHVPTSQEISEAMHSSVVKSIKEGFSYVLNNSLILGLMVSGFVIVMFGFPYQTVLPVFARDVLNSGEAGLGLIGAAGGAGALFGSLVVAISNRPRHLLSYISGGAIGLGAIIIFFGLSGILVISILLAVLAGFLLQLSFAANFALLQVTVPDNLRGRVLSIRFIVFGLSPAGTLFLGVTAETYGVQAATAATGLLCLIGALIALILFPSLRPMLSKANTKV
jgi:predicted MFS family arabinose efflux permease